MIEDAIGGKILSLAKEISNWVGQEPKKRVGFIFLSDESSDDYKSDILWNEGHAALIKKNLPKILQDNPKLKAALAVALKAAENNNETERKEVSDENRL